MTITWKSVMDVQDTLGAFIKAEGLSSLNDEDNEKLLAMVGMASEGFMEFMETVHEDSRADVQGVIATAPDVTLGMELLAAVMTSKHLSGVLAGVAAAHQVGQTDNNHRHTDDLRGDKDR